MHIKTEGIVLIGLETTITGIKAAVQNKNHKFKQNQRVKHVVVTENGEEKYIIHQAKVSTLKADDGIYFLEIESMARNARKSHIQLLTSSPP